MRAGVVLPARGNAGLGCSAQESETLLSIHPVRAAAGVPE